MAHFRADFSVFLHFQDYVALEDFIILQNTWATDAVFAVLDNFKVLGNKGKFSEEDLNQIWREKQYDPLVHKKLLSLMMQFELCYQIDYSLPKTYIIPEMLSNTPPASYAWNSANDLLLYYRYDFMPKGILSRLIVRLHKHIAVNNGEQVAWKTGVKIDGLSLDSIDTTAEIIESWDNRQLLIRVQGSFKKQLMSIITYQVDELNNEYFKQVRNDYQSKKNRFYKMVPCNCKTCKNNESKHYYDYKELLERRAFGKETIQCNKIPYEEVNINTLLGEVFTKENTTTLNIEMPNNLLDIKEKKPKSKDKRKHLAPTTVKVFLASSSELFNEREQFEIFLGRENKRLIQKGIFLQFEKWEHFLDAMSQTRLQDEYNKAIEGCDIFVMMYFTKVGIYTSEEFEKAFKQFKETDKPKIYTYFKKGNVKTTDMNRNDLMSLWNFQDKLKELGHFNTEFEHNAELFLHFKNQLERLYNF